MALKNYTTQIDYFKTIGEIEKSLSESGVTHINKIYEDGLPVAVYFTLMFKGQPVNYKLPCNYEATFKILDRDRNVPTKLKTKEQAIRVSWRIIKDWITAQMAIIETQMVSMEQVFLPYTIVNNEGETLFEKIQGNPHKLLN